MAYEHPFLTSGFNLLTPLPSFMQTEAKKREAWLRSTGGETAHSFSKHVHQEMKAVLTAKGEHNWCRRRHLGS